MAKRMMCDKKRKLKKLRRAPAATSGGDSLFFAPILTEMIDRRGETRTGRN